MSTDTEWETIEAPRGDYVKWDTEGKVVTGTVVAYGDAAGTTIQGEPCPELTVETTDGDLATISASQTALGRALMSAGLQKGDLVRIEYTGDATTKKGNTVKQFDVKLKRGNGTPAPSSATSPQLGVTPQYDETPF